MSSNHDTSDQKAHSLFTKDGRFFYKGKDDNKLREATAFQAKQNSYAKIKDMYRGPFGPNLFSPTHIHSDTLDAAQKAFGPLYKSSTATTYAPLKEKGKYGVVIKKHVETKQFADGTTILTTVSDNQKGAGIIYDKNKKVIQHSFEMARGDDKTRAVVPVQNTGRASTSTVSVSNPNPKPSASRPSIPVHQQLPNHLRSSTKLSVETLKSVLNNNNNTFGGGSFNQKCGGRSSFNSKRF